jgi:hypothetical protein
MYLRIYAARKPSGGLCLVQRRLKTTDLESISKKTKRFTIEKINCIMLFREIIGGYSENRTKPINTLRGENAELLVVKASGRAQI